MKKLLSITISLLCIILTVFPGTLMADPAIGGVYNFQQADYYATIESEAGYANYRLGPGLEYSVFEPIYNGEQVHVIETADNYLDGFRWAHLDYGEPYGWLRMDNLAEVDNPYVDQVQDDTEHALREGEGLVFERYRNGNYVIPAINLDSPEILALNEESYSILYRNIEIALSGIPYAGNSTGIDYDWHTYGDVLSLETIMEYESLLPGSSVDNVSLSEKRPITTEEFLARIGWSEEEYNSRLYSAIQDELYYQFYDIWDVYPQQYNQSLEDSLAYESIQEDTPFISGEAQVSVIAKIYNHMSEYPYMWVKLYLGTIDQPEADPVNPENTQNDDQYGQAGRILEQVNYYNMYNELTEWHSFMYNKSDILPAERIEHRGDGSEWIWTYCYDEQGRLIAEVLTGLPEEIRYMYPEDYLWYGKKASEVANNPGVSIYSAGYVYEGDQVTQELQLATDYGLLGVKYYYYDSDGRIAEAYGDIRHDYESYEHLVNDAGQPVTRIWYYGQDYEEYVYDDLGRVIRHEEHSEYDVPGVTFGQIYEYFDDKYFNNCYISAQLMSDYGVYCFEMQDTAGHTLFTYTAGDEDIIIYDEEGYLREIDSGTYRTEFIYMRE